MARVKLSSAYTPIDEGVYIFRIYDANYDEEFGKITMKLVTADGETHIERFSLMRDKSTVNEGAVAAFSLFAKMALNDFDVEDVEPEELIDCYIGGEIRHSVTPSKKTPGQISVFANMYEKFPADGFDTEPNEKSMSFGRTIVETVEPEEEPQVNYEELDLDALLG